MLRSKRVVPANNNGHVPAKKRSLDDKTRMEILRIMEEDPKATFVSLASKFGVSDRTISKVKNDADKIRERYGLGNPKTRDSWKRTVSNIKEPFERKMYQWISELTSRKVELPPSLVMQRARVKALSMDSIRLRPPQAGFIASWDGGEIDENDPALVQALNSLRHKISSYDLDLVYNMDETGLLYRVQPHYSVLCPSEANDARGKKPSKDRVSLLVCTNATGTHKIPLLMVGKVKQPACFKGYAPRIPYTHQRRAWCDQRVFQHWFYKVFIPSVRALTSQRVQLILDNAPGHCQSIDHPSVEIAFMPPNITARYQPMDQGVIAALKKRYKFKLYEELLRIHDKTNIERESLTKLVLSMKRGTAGVEYGRPPQLRDTIEILHGCWTYISKTVAANSWKKITLLSPPTPENHQCDVNLDV
ncbi:hypothetical protein LEN26_015144 [Aphanomyces euteiches]|nr:hypothetical protein LEN26_015144 [Aphanomyces euteiches]KAH9106812.1 hypothetical protein AeMF1_017688 [Aphanomyces euteiches]